MSASPVPLNLSLSYEGRQVRCIGTDERPEWIAIDLCANLGLRNVSEALSNIPDNEKGISIADTLRGKQSLATVYEAGLYRLMFKSRKPEAEKFKTWLCNEVLPSIRKYGMYPPPKVAPGFVQVPAGEYELLRGYVAKVEDQMHLMLEEQRRANEKIRQILAAPAVHIPTHATPRETVQGALAKMDWAEALAPTKPARKIRALIRRQANIWLLLRYSETPDVSGGPGSPCIYYAHQTAVLHEAVTYVRDAITKREAAKNAEEEKRQPKIPFNVVPAA